MGRRSSIAVNPAILKSVNDAIGRGCTIDAIKVMLDEMADAVGTAEISRSAIGRHYSKYNDMAQRQRDIRAAADAFASEFGDTENNQTSLMIQLVTTLITEKIMGSGQGEGTAMDLRLLSAAVKDAIGAAKIDDDRRRTIRKEAFAEAAKIVETEGKAAGAGVGALAQITKALGMAQ